jgi:hypothetical protein
MPATTNDSEIAGPALVAAAMPVSTKIPVPMITPMPKTVRSQADSSFLSRCSGSSVSWIDCSIDLVRSTSMPWHLPQPPTAETRRLRPVPPDLVEAEEAP